MATAGVGQLIYRRKRPSGMPVQEAVLLGDHGQELQIMGTAELRRIDPNGILMRGYVTDHSQASQRSTEVWWCVYRPEGDLAP